MNENELIDWDAIALDSSNIRALKAAAGAKKYPVELKAHELGRSRDSFGTKVHLAIDSSGVLLSFCLSGGQDNESQYAKTLLNRVRLIRKSGHLKSRPNEVLADKGYSSQKLRNHLKIKGIKAVIPFKNQSKWTQKTGYSAVQKT